MDFERGERVRVWILAGAVAIMALASGGGRAEPAGLGAHPGVEARFCGAPTLRERPALSADRFTATAADAATPWMAKLEIVEAVHEDGALSISNCGAAAIAPEWLLTAAHCVSDGGWLSIRATLGATDLRSRAAIRRTASSAVCHAGYDAKTLSHDLALVRLSTPLPPEFPLARVAEAAEIARLERGALAQSAGWDRRAGGRISRWMRRSEVRILKAAAPGDGVIVAAPTRNEGSLCVGESGGPLIGDLGAGPALMGVFSSVDAYRHPATGELVEICAGFEARSYFTSIPGLSSWIDGVRSTCAADPAACLSDRPLRAAALR